MYTISTLIEKSPSRWWALLVMKGVKMLELKEVKHSNWLECIELDVHDWQRPFVNPNIFSLAEAYVHSDANTEEAIIIIDAFRLQFITMMN